jgi:glycosyltransferase involved in cell wall biosynthesis
MIGVCNTYECFGGAAKAADRLFTSLLAQGDRVTYFVKYKRSDRDNVIELPRPQSISAKRNQLGALGLAKYAAFGRSIDPANEAELHRRVSAWHPVGVFTSDVGPCGVDDLGQVSREIRIWNLHWIAEFLNQPEILPWMANIAPIVWTLHDKAPFSAGWHYSPASSRLPLVLQLYIDRMLRRKRKTIAKIPSHRMVIVSPSRWLGRESQRSELFGRFRHEVIPNCVPTATFTPEGRVKCRQRLGLSDDEFVFGCVSQALDDPRKNYHSMINALESLASLIHKPFSVLSVGQGGLRSASFKCLNLGTLANEGDLAETYSAMDCFVCPSLEDNLPNTILEAISCGCPSVAFNSGGISDLVRTGQTGWLVEDRSADGLASALVQAANQTTEQRTSLSANCRDTALREYSEDQQSRRYRQLFNQMLSGAWGAEVSLS